MSIKIQRVVESIEYGDAPHWDVASQSLYFVDILGKAIHKYVPQTNKHTKAVIGKKHVSFIIPVARFKQRFLISIGRDLVLVKWDGHSEQVTDMEIIYEIDKSASTLHNRFNDGKCDALGRLWAGSIGAQTLPGHTETNKGTLISIGPFRKVKRHLRKIGVSNGLTWSLNNKYFYYIDSHKNTINRYNFNIVSGIISNPKCIFSLSATNIPGWLDGMTIDTDGNLWVAVCGGDCVIKIDPQKTDSLLETLRLPAHQITSITFGGPRLDDLYVTTGKMTIDGVEYPPPDHGATYVISGLGAQGLPAVNFKL